MRIIDFYESGRQAHWLEKIHASDWDAAQLLYDLLKTGRFRTWAGASSTVLLLTDGDELVAFCTYAEQDDIQPAPYAPWIGFVYTAPAFRGRRLAGRLIRCAENRALWDGYTSTHISTGHDGLYEKYGYRLRECLPTLTGEPARVYEKRLLNGPESRAQLSVFHVDSGRRYFSPDDLRDMIDALSENGLDALELTVGNGGWRFLLEDMAVDTGEERYSGEAVAAAVRAGNRAYHDCGVNELTEGEMADLMAYAAAKNIRVVPLLNSPGHMQAVVTAMRELGIEGASYRGSGSAVDLENPAALRFVTALVRKYAAWFIDHGAQAVNLGGDEYANDLDAEQPGFSRLLAEGRDGYPRFVRYINSQADFVKRLGAVPLLFNDGMYYAGSETGGDIDRRAVSAYWCPGWAGYDLASAAHIAKKGHAVLNTNWAWYYVLGRSGTGADAPDFTYEKALEGIARVPGTEAAGSPDVKPVGRMLCLWCDEPGAPYGAKERGRVHTLLRRFAETE